MKLCIYTDNHFCRSSSIVRKSGEQFSIRLENQIKSIEWVEQLASGAGVDSIICLGDFFDSNILHADELTALQTIKWNNISKVFLAGNHEMYDLTASSSLIFNLLPNAKVMINPQSYIIGNTQICFLPYILEENRKTISDYFGEIPENKKRVIFSHNDIAGIQMGQFKSKTGFDIDDITKNCDLFINGHLHNSWWVNDKIFNVGNLTGQNFGEDGFKFEHIALIFDTETLKITPYMNPFSFNFYKLEISGKSESDIIKIKNTLKDNAVVTIKCTEDQISFVKQLFDGDKIVAFRLLLDVQYQIENAFLADDAKTFDLNGIDYLEKFREYCLNEIGASDLLKEELQEVCR